ncbi:MAG: beta-ketoacyl-[acyl-carrier-protein] synthase family protein [Rikenellaceae bacterium]
MGVKVCGLGVVSAIGVGCAESLASLCGEVCGIAPLTLFESEVNSPVGEVKLSNDELKELLGIESGRSVSRTALLGALAAREAVRDANIEAGRRVGLISATSVGGMDLSEEFYRDYIKDCTKGRLRDIVGHDCATSTNLIAEICGVDGFRTTISTACSSAANAIIMGAQMLECDMLDYVVVGGCDALCRFTYNGFNSLMILDSELCRPVDSSRKGLNLGEGGGYLVLTKDEGCAKSYCNLVGYANANDAHHQTASSAEGNGAYLAMSEALAMSGLAKIDYINLHGTGTPNNDSSELAAITRLFTESLPLCSSTKSATGHTLAASGGVEATFSVLSLIEGRVWANLRFQEAIEPYDIEPVRHLIECDNIESVMTNSFGFGGNCSSLIFAI